MSAVVNKRNWEWLIRITGKIWGSQVATLVATAVLLVTAAAHEGDNAVLWLVALAVLGSLAWFLQLSSRGLPSSADAPAAAELVGPMSAVAGTVLEARNPSLDLPGAAEEKGFEASIDIGWALEFNGKTMRGQKATVLHVVAVLTAGYQYLVQTFARGCRSSDATQGWSSLSTLDGTSRRLAYCALGLILLTMLLGLAAFVYFNRMYDMSCSLKWVKKPGEASRGSPAVITVPVARSFGFSLA